MLSRLSGAAFAAALSLATASPVLAHDYKAGAIEIGHPWARATPNGAKVAGGYLTLRNRGKTPDRLVSATVSVAGRAEIHRMDVTDGVMTMRPQPDGVAAPAGEEIKLAPGGYHLMLLDLKTPLKAGERFSGALTFEKAGVIEVEFAVEAIGASKPAEPRSGEHSGH